MIYSSQRVPGQLLPVGAKWNQNAGQPLHVSLTGKNLTTLKGLGELSGISSDLRADAVAGVNDENMRMGTLLILSLIIRGGLGYIAGRAMSPNVKDKNKYGWVGVASGGLFGVTGLAVQGLISMSKK